MNLTLSVDEKVVERARQAAKATGKSLNQAIREYLERLAGTDDAERDIAEMRRLTAEGKGNSGGWKFNRDEIYDREIFRR